MGVNTNLLCTKAFNGKQALEKVQKNIALTGECTIELILMDCNMPFMDGYTATAKILEECAGQDFPPYVAAVTGHTEQQYI